MPVVGRTTCLENVLNGALGRLRGPRYGVRSYPKKLRTEAFDQLERVGLVNQAYQRAAMNASGTLSTTAMVVPISAIQIVSIVARRASGKLSNIGGNMY